MEPQDIPVLPRGVRIHRDRVRDTWVLLAPERTLVLDDIGHAILSEVDGARDFGAIAAGLAVKYAAPVEQITQDAAAFLGGLRQRRFLDIAR
ncbi:pyrroloquinoline quinone biosynthesis peptide chaperone PqqD [Sulfitobacter sp. LCG007]